MKQRALARPALTDNRDLIARRDLQVQIAKNHQILVARTVNPGKFLDTNQCGDRFPICPARCTQSRRAQSNSFLARACSVVTSLTSALAGDGIKAPPFVRDEASQ